MPFMQLVTVRGGVYMRLGTLGGLNGFLVRFRNLVPVLAILVNT